MKRALASAVLALLGLVTGCTSNPRESSVDQEKLAAEVRATLDDFHAAAAAADGPRYFAHFAPDGVFLGTDATERWTVDAFKAYAKPHFDAGHGWTYHATERHVGVDAQGAYAWFDEALENAKLGPCRGSGVLRHEPSGWKIVQYNLTIPIPNDLALDVAAQIRQKLQGPVDAPPHQAR
jgi:ketosteroid isomerase-like protein